MKIIKVKAINYLDNIIKEKVYVTKNQGAAGNNFLNEYPELKTEIHHIETEEIRKY